LSCFIIWALAVQLIVEVAEIVPTVEAVEIVEVVEVVKLAHSSQAIRQLEN